MKEGHTERKSVNKDIQERACCETKKGIINPFELVNPGGGQQDRLQKIAK
jgi:hypothetical protein